MWLEIISSLSKVAFLWEHLFIYSPICLFIGYLSCKIHECIVRVLVLWGASHSYFFDLWNMFLNLCIRLRPPWSFEHEITTMFPIEMRNVWWAKKVHDTWKSRVNTKRKTYPRGGICLDCYECGWCVLSQIVTNVHISPCGYMDLWIV